MPRARRDTQRSGQASRWEHDKFEHCNDEERDVRADASQGSQHEQLFTCSTHDVSSSSTAVPVQASGATTTVHLCEQGYDVLEQTVGSEDLHYQRAPMAQSESSFGGWDVLTDVPSEAAGIHQTFLLERVHELEAEVERLTQAQAPAAQAQDDLDGNALPQPPAPAPVLQAGLQDAGDEVANPPVHVLLAMRLRDRAKEVGSRVKRSFAGATAGKGALIVAVVAVLGGAVVHLHLQQCRQVAEAQQRRRQELRLFDAAFADLRQMQHDMERAAAAAEATRKREQEEAAAAAAKRDRMQSAETAKRELEQAKAGAAARVQMKALQQIAADATMQRKMAQAAVAEAEMRQREVHKAAEAVARQVKLTNAAAAKQQELEKACEAAGEQQVLNQAATDFSASYKTSVVRNKRRFKRMYVRVQQALQWPMHSLGPRISGWRCACKARAAVCGRHKEAGGDDERQCP